MDKSISYRICNGCGGEYYSPKFSNAKNDKSHYCSRLCRKIGEMSAEEFEKYRKAEFKKDTGVKWDVFIGVEREADHD